MEQGSSYNFAERRLSLDEIVKNSMDITDIKDPVKTTAGININYLSSLPKRPSVNVTWKNVEYSVKIGLFKRDEKKLLHNLSGNFRSGKLTAIMGPSGAGKSTFLSVLSGYRSQGVKGEILVNGNQRDLNNFRKVSCFIMQTDYLIQELTVKESMKIAVNLKIPKGVSDSHKGKIILEIIEALNLTGEVDKRVKCLSGGQKKRLSVAMELVNNPSVMFLDEPTSGLDSSTCLRCICLLKALAMGGRTVVCTIHQPSSRLFFLFDDLYMMSNGRCIYHGPVSELVPFLSAQGLHCPSLWNPADYITELAIGDDRQLETTLADIVSKNFDNLQTSFNGSFAVNPQISQNGMILSDKEIPLPPQRYATSSWNQFKVLTKRNFIADIRHPSFLFVRLLGHVVVGLVTGVVFYNIGNNAFYIFKNLILLLMFSLFVSFAGVLPTFFTIPDEMNVFRRENGNSWYSLKMYYLAKTFVEIPFQIIFPMTYICLVYWLTAQPNEFWRFASFSIFMVLSALGAQSYALIFVSAFSFKVALFLGPITLIPTCVFSGFLASKEFLPTGLHWTFYLSHFKYTLEGLVTSIYAYNRTALICPKDKYCPIAEPKVILRELDIEEKSSVFLDILPFISLILVFRFVALLIMVWKMRIK